MSYQQAKLNVLLHFMVYLWHIPQLLTAENCTLSTMVTSEMAVQSALLDAGEKRQFQRFLDALLRIMEHCDHLEHSFSDILLSIIEK